MHSAAEVVASLAGVQRMLRTTEVHSVLIQCILFQSRQLEQLGCRLHLQSADMQKSEVVTLPFSAGISAHQMKDTGHHALTFPI